jgi:hypothetical protein
MTCQNACSSACVLAFWCWHASGDETVMISGLTESTELSLGTFAAASGWLVAARDG